MSDDYFSDRVERARPRLETEVSTSFWSGVVSLLGRTINTNLFAEDFPDICEETGQIYGTYREQLLGTIEGEIPSLHVPLTESEIPPTLAVMDLFEFLYRHASRASRANRHGFYDHHHLDFDRELGRRELRDSTNRLLSRNEMAYEMNDNGRIERIVPAAVGKQISRGLPPSRDAELDEMLDQAVEKYLDPDSRRQLDGLEKLWDVFERSKTVLSGKDKKARIESLIQAAVSSDNERHLLEVEMNELTRIGNLFQVRHHEVDKEKPDSEMVDYLFARMYALLCWLHPALR